MGNIHVRSPYPASRYYNDERTKNAIIDGWANAGDMGSISSARSPRSCRSATAINRPRTS